MTIGERIEKVRALAITAKTAIYNEDAMTAIELAGVTACKVNECVEAINEMLKLLESVGLSSLKYDPDSEGLIV